jgi:hypothetical protein
LVSNTTVLKKVMMTVAAVTEVVLTSNEFEGQFKGVSMRHLRNVYPTLYCSHDSIKNALAELCEFGLLEKLEFAGENCPRWVPTKQGREVAKRMVIEDEKLYLYYPGIQRSDTRVTYERVRDIIRNQIQENHIIREDDFYKTGCVVSILMDWKAVGVEIEQEYLNWGLEASEKVQEETGLRRGRR